MTLLETLRQDHQEALDILDRARREVKGLGLGELPLTPGLGSPALAEFLQAWDRTIEFHFRQEEEALFPVLGEVIGTGAGPIAVMLEEHQVLREAVARLKEAVAEAVPETAAVLPPAQTIVSVLTDHIHKEDEVLFPMAEEMLRAEQLVEVDRRAAALAR